MSQPETLPQRHNLKLLAAGLFGCAFTLANLAHGINSTASDSNEQCPAPSPSTIATVAQLYDHMEKIPSLNEGDRQYDGPAYDRYMQDKQRELDIQLPYLSNNNLKSLTATMYKGIKIPFKDYEFATRQILDQIDVPLFIGLPPNIPKQVAYGSVTPTDKELETTRAKNEVLDIANMFGRLPKNLTHNVGIKAVAIVAHSTVAGFAVTSEGVLVTDITNVGEYDRTTALHEFAHLVDASICGPTKMYNDPAYSGLNQHAGYAHTYLPSADFIKSQPITFEKIKSGVYASEDNLANSAAAVTAQPGNKPLHDDYCAQADAHYKTFEKIDFISDYSESSAPEDKAEVGKELLTVYTANRLLHHSSPVLRAKGLLFLARIYQRFPNSVKYMALNPVTLDKPGIGCGKPNDYQLVH